MFLSREYKNMQMIKSFKHNEKNSIQWKDNLMPTRNPIYLLKANHYFKFLPGAEDYIYMYT